MNFDAILTYANTAIYPLQFFLWGVPEMLFVNDIQWERIHLTLLVSANNGSFDKDAEFYLVNDQGEVQASFKKESTDGHSLLLSLNITNNGLNRCVANGVYKVVSVSDDRTEIICYSGKPDSLAAWSRNFLYRGSKGVYSVTFMVDEYSQESELQLLFYNADTNPESDKPLSLRKVSLAFRIDTMKKKIRILLYRILRKLSSHKNTILFLSEKSETLPLNMAAVYDRMVERGLDKTMPIVFSLRNRAVKKYSFFSFLQLTKKVANAGKIIVDDHVPLFDYLKLDDSTDLIQIWHAGAGFKGVGYSRWGHYGCPGPYCCHRQYRYCITASQGISSFFSEQFGILNEQIIPTGMPRMDEYLDADHRLKTTDALYAAYPFLNGKTVILFAPTYRGQNRENAYYPYDLIQFDALYEYCTENNAVVLFKMHPWVPGEVPISEQYSDRFFSFNSFPNINDLFYVTDLLITDYSSSMYEFMLMKKPMLFFAFDKNQYATSRGFHRDYDSNVPGKVCSTFEELMKALKCGDFEYDKVEQFLGTYFDNIDTGSRDRIIDWLILDQLPEEFKTALENRKEKEKAIHRMVIPVENT